VDDPKTTLRYIVSLARSDNNPARANEIVAKLNQLHQMAPELAIIPAHGRSAYLKFFPAGSLTCIASDVPRKKEKGPAEAEPQFWSAAVLWTLSLEGPPLSSLQR